MYSKKLKQKRCQCVSNERGNGVKYKNIYSSQQIPLATAATTTVTTHQTNNKLFSNTIYYSYTAKPRITWPFVASCGCCCICVLSHVFAVVGQRCLVVNVSWCLAVGFRMCIKWKFNIASGNMKRSSGWQRTWPYTSLCYKHNTHIYHI